MRRKIAGIVGGLGHESTIEYYRAIVAGYRRRVGDGSYPGVVINSIDLKALLDHVAAGRLGHLTEWLSAEIDRLVRAGIDFALLASNTPHIVFDRLAQRAQVPLISIVDAARFYPSGLERSGISAVLPSLAEQERVHGIYTGELLNGIFRDESRAQLEAIIARAKAAQGIDAVLLAGTELPLLLREAAYEGLPVIDTAKAHVARIVEALVS